MTPISTRWLVIASGSPLRALSRRADPRRLRMLTVSIAMHFLLKRTPGLRVPPPMMPSYGGPAPGGRVQGREILPRLLFAPGRGRPEEQGRRTIVSSAAEVGASAGADTAESTVASRAAWRCQARPRRARLPWREPPALAVPAGQGGGGSQEDDRKAPRRRLAPQSGRKRLGQRYLPRTLLFLKVTASDESCPGWQMLGNTSSPVIGFPFKRFLAHWTSSLSRTSRLSTLVCKRRQPQSYP